MLALRTVLMGATLPLLARHAVRREEQIGTRIGGLYAINTAGAVAGALATAFWLPAQVWTDGHRANRCRDQRVRVLVRGVARAVERCAARRMAFHAAITRAIRVGSLVLRTNGLPEAVIDMPGTPPRFSGELWLSPLAVIARPAARSMLVVGYGGGVVIEGVPPSVQRVDVIELEPRVIDANRATHDKRRRDPLLDPRVNLISNDARGALALADRKYDATVSQPSHPWTACASHLYTLEFMQQAGAHLSYGGVFVQWMNVTFLDEALLRSLTATLLQAFGEVRLYRPARTRTACSSRLAIVCRPSTTWRQLCAS